MQTGDIFDEQVKAIAAHIQHACQQRHGIVLPSGQGCALNASSRAAISSMAREMSKGKKTLARSTWASRMKKQPKLTPARQASQRCEGRAAVPSKSKDKPAPGPMRRKGPKAPAPGAGLLLRLTRPPLKSPPPQINAEVNAKKSQKYWMEAASWG